MMYVCDSKGIISKDRANLNASKQELAEITNKEGINGTIADAIKDTDIFVGVSGPGTVTQDMLKAMAKDSIVFALANPIQKYTQTKQKQQEQSSRYRCSDFPNQINNVLAFPVFSAEL